MFVKVKVRFWYQFHCRSNSMKIASICRKIRGETVGRVYPCRCHFSISKSSASDSFGWPVSERFEIDSCKQKKCDTFSVSVLLFRWILVSFSDEKKRIFNCIRCNLCVFYHLVFFICLCLNGKFVYFWLLHHFFFFNIILYGDYSYFIRCTTNYLVYRWCLSIWPFKCWISFHSCGIFLCIHPSKSFFWARMDLCIAPNRAL